MRDTSKFFMQFVRLAGPFWQSENKATIRSLSLALGLLTVLQIVIWVLINKWSAYLFDALEQRSMSRLITQSLLIILIFLANIFINATHITIKRRLQLDWRGWLTDKLIGSWMRDGRHYLVTHLVGQHHDNPDGRIAEDIRIATEYSIDFLHSIFYCLLLLISFTEILWVLSGTVTLDLGLFSIPFHGHLVMLAFMYAAGASVLGWLIGKPLTKATDHRQTNEANFRFALVKARENSMAIALIRGEPHEKPHFNRLFDDIVTAWNQQTHAWARIMMLSSGNAVLTVAFPILISAPRYVLGLISLGTLMQSAQAIQQLASALSWPVDNMGKMAEWRASVERVLGLSIALEQLEREINKTDSTRVRIEKNQEAVLRFKSLCLQRLDGMVCIPCLNEEVHPGEWISIEGNIYTGNKLFKAIAGLWPWGQGGIELPDDDLLLFMPPRPYLPTDTLRAAVCYPAESNAFDNQALTAAFDLAGVSELLAQLDYVADWEKNLEREQQQRLGMARLLLHKPKWILMQEAFASLDPEMELQMMEIIRNKLPQAALLTISKQPAVKRMHARHIMLN